MILCFSRRDLSETLTGAPEFPRNLARTHLRSGEERRGKERAVKDKRKEEVNSGEKKMIDECMCDHLCWIYFEVKSKGTFQVR